LYPSRGNLLFQLLPANDVGLPDKILIIGAHGSLAESQGRFDSAAYQRQLDIQ
jgi:hypothetical protein